MPPFRLDALELVNAQELTPGDFFVDTGSAGRCISVLLQPLNDAPCALRLGGETAFHVIKGALPRNRKVLKLAAQEIHLRFDPTAEPKANEEQETGLIVLRDVENPSILAAKMEKWDDEYPLVDLKTWEIDWQYPPFHGYSTWKLSYLGSDRNWIDLSVSPMGAPLGAHS